MIKSLIDSTRFKFSDLPYMCHQMPERSFFYKGSQLPVCARCCGVWFGQFVSLMYLMIMQNVITISISIVLCIPSLVDWTIQNFFWKIESNNIRRLITGILLGIGYLSIILNLLIHYWHYFKLGE